METELILFSECNDEQLIEHSKRVLMGEFTIYALIGHDRSFAVPRNTTYEEEYVASEFRPFVIACWVHYDHRYDGCLYGGTAYDRRGMFEWLDGQHLRLPPGTYELPQKFTSQCALDFVNGNKIYIDADLVYSILKDGQELRIESFEPCYERLDYLIEEGKIDDVVPIVDWDNWIERQPQAFPLAFGSKPGSEKIKVTKSDPVKVLMMRYLDQTNGRGEFRECIEFLLKDPEMDEGDNGKILWTSYSGKPQNAKRKTLQNRLIDYRKEWKQNN